MTTRIEITLAQDLLYRLIGDCPNPQETRALQLTEIAYMLDDLVQIHNLLDELQIRADAIDTQGPLNLAQRVRLLAEDRGFSLKDIPDDQFSQLAFNLF